MTSTFPAERDFDIYIGADANIKITIDLDSLPTGRVFELTIHAKNIEGDVLDHVFNETSSPAIIVTEVPPVLPATEASKVTISLYLDAVFTAANIPAHRASRYHIMETTNGDNILWQKGGIVGRYL